MNENYAVMDSRGIITDHLADETEAYREYERLCDEGFDFSGDIIIIKIINYVG